MKKSNFNPVWWARNPHIQTILPLLTKVKSPTLTRQRLDTHDGDFIDLDWLCKPKNNQPILVIVHGLEGSAQSHYARRMLTACQRQNISAVVHHHRSCSGEPNRLARSYHSGDTQDLANTLQFIKSNYSDSPIWAIGYSLGGNVLCKYLGEQQSQSLIRRAAIVSAPLELNACAKRLEGGFSTVYQRYLIKQLQQKVADKIAHPILGKHMPLTKNDVSALSTFYQFDDKVTAPLHGFTGVQDYYHRASGLPFIASITIPTLILHAQDDPFMTADVIPKPEQLSPMVEYELHPYGGHVGFIQGGKPWRPDFYLEPRVLNFLSCHNNDSNNK
ncbi:MAG: hydrolase [Shewanella sp.]|nr:hydrolase [Shewanella sp.]